MNIAGIDLRLLRSFLVLSKAGSYVRAAQTLHISQPALSQQMADLSAALGVTLFEKVGRRSMLTETGRGLSRGLEGALDHLDKTLLQWSLSESVAAGVLRVGATHTYLKSLALPVSADLLQAHSKLSVDLREMPAHEILEKLQAGDVDIGVLPRMNFKRGLDSEKLFSEPFGILGDRLRIRELGSRKTLRALVNEPVALLNKTFLMRQQVDRQAAADRVTLTIRAEVAGPSNLLALLRSGDLLTVGSVLTVIDEPNLAALPLKGRFLGREAMMCWRSGRPMTRLMAVFAEHAREHAEVVQARLNDLYK
jgi:LysR family transcriptional regulator, cyn operon transcriptional activator